MKKLFNLLIIFCFLCNPGCTNEKSVILKLHHTTDVHGNFFPFDFINNVPARGSMARVSAYMNQQRATHGENLLLLDGGDLLQGQPAVYYYNFVDVTSRHLCASVMNYIKYDVAAMGNHDIEAGHDVYDRWVADCEFPVLGANVLKNDGTPYLPSYKMFVKDGIKIAVVGMITQAIPAWLPENLWSGLHFADIQETASRLIPQIKENENPDLIVGLFHTGTQTAEVAGFKEGVGMEVAQNVDGFDVVFTGHDHTPFCREVTAKSGKKVWVVNPGPGALQISDVTIEFTRRKGKIINKRIHAQLEDIADLEPDKEFLTHFAEAYRKTEAYVNAEIGEFAETISAHDAFFGPSAFIDLIHSLQLKLTNADLSLVAPLAMNAVINSGKVYMRDMFNLYKYENLLYTMNLSGQEVKDALEYSYELWINRMTSEDDHLLLIQPNKQNEEYYFVHPYFAFDSAAGILYTVDVTKPVGQRVEIASMADGTPFDKQKMYRVAVNSYQGSGGAGTLTKGAGIPREQLSQRVLYSTDKDMRFYLGEEIRKEKVVSPQPLNQWSFIPKQWVEKAAERDRKLLFP